MPMREGSFLSLGPHGFHRIAFTLWGAEEGERLVVCVHGLTRNGRDFDGLAAALEDQLRVACPDVPGRGNSAWLADPKDYSYAVYTADMAAFLAHLGGGPVDWIGTSMGGLIGMLLAAQPETPIRRLVLNDIGPFVAKAALARIAAYVGSDPRFPDLDGVETYLRNVHAPFGPLSDSDWRRLAGTSARPDDAGGWRLHYDPAIALNFQQAAEADVDLWAVWDAIRCPVLVLRGAESDLLDKPTAEAMTSRGPKAQLIEFSGVGHAPALVAPEQIEAIRAWLAEGAG